MLLTGLALFNAQGAFVHKSNVYTKILFVIDLAVGAPFGSGSGTVYIFSGVGGNEMLRETQVSLCFSHFL